MDTLVEHVDLDAVKPRFQAAFFTGIQPAEFTRQPSSTHIRLDRLRYDKSIYISTMSYNKHSLTSNSLAF